ncbi:MAG: methylmalonyl Co-A mutase-associated GTPase MeaB [Bacteroidetes bacterium]|nr:methylmalonyl Co-A mutase-associated GTPase MeaB [Bacteroidota bacterium]
MNASFDLDALVEGLVSRERGALARAITLTESQRAHDELLRMDLLDRCVQHLSSSGQAASQRWALTGPPGVGKSTLIDGMGMALIEQGHRVAVLAVDPSSERTGGSILGDKTRMHRLSRQEAAFIRPSPAGTHLGGVAEATREAALVCEVAGYDTILIETVGVGQSEHAVRHMVDLVILVTMLGSGDDLQGIKRGILEEVDLVIVNKTDGPTEKASRQFAGQLEQALGLLRGHDAPEVQCASALTGSGMEDVVQAARTSMQHLQQSGALDHLKTRQQMAWFDDATRHLMIRRLENLEGFPEARDRLRNEVLAQATSPWAAAHRLLERVLPGGVRR